MSGFAVTVERLTIHEHPDADALELAQVGLYRAVVQKGRYRTGDLALYIPEQAILPDVLIEELGLTGRLAGSQKNRVKPVRLRGELSQGIVCVPDGFTPDDLAEFVVTKIDLSDDLGITKWVPEVPVHMSGKVEPAADLIRWIDIENIKRYPQTFAPGERVTATEKIHGTACLLTYLRSNGQIIVSSKGYGEKNLALVEEPGNLYWRAVRGHDVDDFAGWLAEVRDLTHVAVFGEVYGAGIQDLGYGATGKTATPPGYAVFDVRVQDATGTLWWLSQDELRTELSRYNVAHATALQAVPLLYEGPYDEATLFELASGDEQVSGTAANIREGVVVRAEPDRHSAILGGRAILKVISDAYLTRSGGTEYQ